MLNFVMVGLVKNDFLIIKTQSQFSTISSLYNTRCQLIKHRLSGILGSFLNKLHCVAQKDCL